MEKLIRELSSNSQAASAIPNRYGPPLPQDTVFDPSTGTTVGEIKQAQQRVQDDKDLRQATERAMRDGDLENIEQYLAKPRNLLTEPLQTMTEFFNQLQHVAQDTLLTIQGTRPKNEGFENIKTDLQQRGESLQSQLMMKQILEDGIQDGLEQLEQGKNALMKATDAALDRMGSSDNISSASSNEIRAKLFHTRNAFASLYARDANEFANIAAEATVHRLEKKYPNVQVLVESLAQGLEPLPDQQVVSEVAQALQTSRWESHRKSIDLFQNQVYNALGIEQLKPLLVGETNTATALVTSTFNELMVHLAQELSPEEQTIHARLDQLDAMEPTTERAQLAKQGLMSLLNRQLPPAVAEENVMTLLQEKYAWLFEWYEDVMEWLQSIQWWGLLVVSMFTLLAVWYILDVPLLIQTSKQLSEWAVRAFQSFVDSFRRGLMTRSQQQQQQQHQQQNARPLQALQPPSSTSQPGGDSQPTSEEEVEEEEEERAKALSSFNALLTELSNRNVNTNTWYLLDDKYNQFSNVRREFSKRLNELISPLDSPHSVTIRSSPEFAVLVLILDITRDRLQKQSPQTLQKFDMFKQRIIRSYNQGFYNKLSAYYEWGR